MPPASKPRYVSVVAVRVARRLEGMTLVEVLFASAIFSMVFGSVLAGLSRATYRANWSSCSIEATKLAEQRLEQMQSARWSPTSVPPIDELVASNFPVATATLFAYSAGGGLVVTTVVSISTLPNTNSPQYKVLSSSITWSYSGRGPFTNTVTTIRATDS